MLARPCSVIGTLNITTNDLAHILVISFKTTEVVNRIRNKYIIQLGSEVYINSLVLRARPLSL